MDVILILQWFSCIATIVIGLVSLIAPRRTLGFTGLDVQGGRGVTEIRAIFGAMFIALGAVPLLFGDVVAFQMLGITYLALGVVRGVSIWLDKSLVQSNVISFISEIVFGIVLMI